MRDQETSDPPTAPHDPRDSLAPPVSPVPHLASTVERGSFSLARCTCGWSGPARRSRDRARTDAASHQAAD
ncbi:MULTISPECIES: hypothetical protein [unclassified Streptomyces]|uniref:hypothetical protein n=1 Tax=unclassified Streptomyces TaxID=2593676 RepID=UPI0011CAF458|nr:MULTISPECIES: hypothetical protein [unclassified Streptomyces]TXL87119.1 hypothetical protein EW053_22775 [Streptomyces sp. IB2014 016-6]